MQNTQQHDITQRQQTTQPVEQKIRERKRQKKVWKRFRTFEGVSVFASN